jgi:hypothetical protein
MRPSESQTGRRAPTAPSTRRGEPFASPPRDDPGDDPRGGSRTRAGAPVARRYGQPNDPGSARNPRHRRQFRRGSDAKCSIARSRTAGKSPVISALHLPRASEWIAIGGSAGAALRGRARRSSSSPGSGCVITKTAAWHAGSGKVSEICKSAPAASPTVPRRASC